MSNSRQNLDFRRMLPAYRYKAVKSPFCALELIPPLKKKNIISKLLPSTEHTRSVAFVHFFACCGV